MMQVPIVSLIVMLQSCVAGPQFNQARERHTQAKSVM